MKCSKTIQQAFQVCEVFFSVGFFKWSETHVMQKHLNPILYLSLQIEVKKKKNKEKIEKHLLGVSRLYR